MASYLNHFHSFINANLRSDEDRFTKEDMVAWIQAGDNRTPENIVEHLLKRTTNYDLRDENEPPSRLHDDLFFMIEPNVFRRYRPGVDPVPVHSNQTPATPVETRARIVVAPAGSNDITVRFQTAVLALDLQLGGRSLEDAVVKTSVREWLDGNAEPLAWAMSQGMTEDEWFFVTTLYGTMTPEAQRTHIRKFFPLLFVGAAKSNTRHFVPGMPEFAGLRAPWMSKRLCRMGQILRERNLSMNEYVAALREIERNATPYNPMPALDAIVADHRATSSKTLSVFVRDCVGGNCFPIDSRVSDQLVKYGLPEDERLLVGLCLAINRNPRQVARIFYELG
jgi:hypothetical protein